MNIVIDTTPLKNQNAVRGIGRYTQELVQALKAIPSKHSFFTSEEAPKNVDLLHYPFFDLFFPTLPLLKRTRTIVTIHDVIPLLFPRHYKPGIKGSINFLRQKLALRGVSHIITDSQISRRDIHEKLKVPLEKISAVPLASGISIKRPIQAVLDTVKKKYELPKTYLLYVGDINYNKNLPFLLRVIARIPRLTLVMVGKQLNNTAIPEGKAIHDLLRSLEITDRTIMLTDIEDIQDLSAIYALATAYIQPSLYEGFGLPVLEAMKCKTIVLSSLGGSLPEVIGESALFFHPHDEDECEQCIRKALRMNQISRNKLIRMGLEKVEEYSWERTAKETLAVYDSVLSSV